MDACTVLGYVDQPLYAAKSRINLQHLYNEVPTFGELLQNFWQILLQALHVLQQYQLSVTVVVKLSEQQAPPPPGHYLLEGPLKFNARGWRHALFEPMLGGIKTFQFPVEPSIQWLDSTDRVANFMKLLCLLVPETARCHTQGAERFAWESSCVDSDLLQREKRTLNI